MIPRPRPERFRLRRTMMFMNAQKPGLIKDAYIYGCDSIMLDLEDAVAENQKDAARFSLYHALKSVDYRAHQRPGHPPLAGGRAGVRGRRGGRHPHRQV